MKTIVDNKHSLFLLSDSVYSHGMQTNWFSGGHSWCPDGCYGSYTLWKTSRLWGCSWVRQISRHVREVNGVVAYWPIKVKICIQRSICSVSSPPDLCEGQSCLKRIETESSWDKARTPLCARERDLEAQSQHGLTSKHEKWRRQRCSQGCRHPVLVTEIIKLHANDSNDDNNQMWNLRIYILCKISPP